MNTFTNASPYASYGNYYLISGTFPILFSNKMLVLRAEVTKMLVVIANRKDPYRTAKSISGIRNIILKSQK